jgi:hypothetical protein
MYASPTNVFGGKRTSIAVASQTHFMSTHPNSILMDWIKGQLAKTYCRFYPMAMMREPSMIILIVLSAALATPTLAQTGNILGDNYSIMVPEKGSKQKVSKQKASKKKASKQEVSKQKVSTQKASKQNVSKREQPEPWLAPKYNSPSGTQEVRIPKSKSVSPPSAPNPGYVYVPQTGRSFQNLPSVGGGNTFQDRAIRCTHQAGVYGQVGANRGAYMGGCL